MAKGRPGGNPEIMKYGYKPKGDKVLKVANCLRTTKEMADAMKSGVLERDWTDIAREAIAKALAEKGVHVE